MNRPALIVFAVLTGIYSAAAFGREKVVAYVPNWVNLKTFSESIDYARITHINVAFENPVNDDGDLSFAPKNGLLIAKAHSAGVKVLVSLGGGSAATDKAMLKRYASLLKSDNRTGFVAKIDAYLQKNDFDGVDLDLEGPGIGTDYGAFVADLAGSLRRGKMLLTAALSMEYGGASVPESILKDFDFVNIMAYDGAGPWDPKSPGPHSSLPYAKKNVDYWIKRGLPKSSAVLGVPFYGYGFGDAFRKRAFSYAQIVADYPGAENADQAGSTIWYNGIPTVKAKAEYVLDEGLGGMMIWSLDNDAKGKKSLLVAIDAALNPAMEKKK